MARAKCRICGKTLDTSDAHLVTTKDKKGKDKKAYYCSKEEYEAEEQRKAKASEDKDRIYKAFCEILKVDGITNTALWKEKAEINKVFTDEKIAECLEANKEWLTDAVSKLNGNLYGKIRYVSTVLKNTLGDFKPKAQEREFIAPIIQEEHYETKFKLKQRTALLDLEEDCDE